MLLFGVSHEGESDSPALSIGRNEKGGNVVADQGDKSCDLVCVFIFINKGPALWQVLVTHIRNFAFPVGAGNEGVGDGECFQPYSYDGVFVLLLKVSDHVITYLFVPMKANVVIFG